MTYPSSVRTPLRTALGALLTTVVVLSVPVVSLASTASAAEPAAPGTAAATDDGTAPQEYSRSEATAVFEQLQKALEPKKLPVRTLGDPLPRKDLSLLLREAQVAKPAMSARQQSIIDSNNRPVSDADGCSPYTPLLQARWEALSSDHFCVHYRPSLSANGGGATLQQARNTIFIMEQVYAKEVTALGFRRPVLDSDGLYDVFLDQIGDEGYYGFCTTDTPSRVSTAWCGLDNDFAVGEFGAPPLNSLKVTAAHEFFHAVQFAYDAGDSTWFLEGTAVWMEDQVYPDINDYLQYLNFSQLKNYRQSVDYVGSLHRYSSVIFWKYLSERFNDVSIIRKIWETAAVSAGGRTGIQATASVLGSRGSSLPTEFARYGVWNTLPAGTYDDRRKFPTYKSCGKRQWCPAASGTLSTRTKSTGSQQLRLNHYATAPVILRAGSSLPSRTKIVLRVNGPDSSRGTQARVQVRYKNGKVTTYTIHLNRSGNGAKAVTFNPKKVSSAVLTLSNGGSTNSQLFTFRAGVRY